MSREVPLVHPGTILRLIIFFGTDAQSWCNFKLNGGVMAWLGRPSMRLAEQVRPKNSINYIDVIHGVREVFVAGLTPEAPRAPTRCSENAEGMALVGGRLTTQLGLGGRLHATSGYKASISARTSVATSFALSMMRVASIKALRSAGGVFKKPPGLMS